MVSRRVEESARERRRRVRDERQKDRPSETPDYIPYSDDHDCDDER